MSDSWRIQIHDAIGFMMLDDRIQNKGAYVFGNQFGF